MKIEVPCNVGDFVYQIDKSMEKIDTKKVAKIEIHIGKTFNTTYIVFETSGFCRASDFGKSVFIDYAEALHTLDRERT